MPRPNKPRSIHAEQYIRARVQRERQNRGWSMEALARRVTAAGCPISHSAIYKLEEGDPPRRVVGDEIVAFAQVFNLTVEQLMRDPALAAQDELTGYLERRRALILQCSDVMSSFTSQIEDAEAQIRDLVSDNPGLRELVDARLGDSAGPLLAGDGIFGSGRT